MKNKLYLIRITTDNDDYQDFVYAQDKRTAAIYFEGRINKRMLEEQLDDRWNWSDLMQYIKES